MFTTCMYPVTSGVTAATAVGLGSIYIMCMYEHTSRNQSLNIADAVTLCIHIREIRESQERERERERDALSGFPGAVLVIGTSGSRSFTCGKPRKRAQRWFSGRGKRWAREIEELTTSSLPPTVRLTDRRHKRKCWTCRSRILNRIQFL